MATTPDDSTAAAAALTAAGWRARELAGFAGLVGPLWTRLEDAGWVYGLQTTTAHANPAGVVHGGLSCTLIDHALSAIAWQSMNRQACVTVQLDTHFLAAVAVGSFIEARGQIVRAAGSLIFMRGELTVAGAPVLSAAAVLKLLKA